MILLELALRAAGPARLALRERSPGGAAAAADTTRILHIGESTTYGLGVRPDQAYPAVLERLLSERYAPRTFATYNRGVPGLTTTAMLHSLDEKLASLHPDVVAIMAGANDFNERLNGLSDGLDALPQGPLRRLVGNLRLYKVTRLALELSRPEVKLQDGEILYFRHGASVNVLYDEPRDDARIAQLAARLEDNLERMIARVRAAGARVVLVGYIQSFEENRIVAALAERTGAIYVSTYLEPHERAPELFTEDGWHPSPMGHRHIARRLAEALPLDPRGGPLATAARG